jgi:AraC-like DNA-binding protein
MRPVIQKLPLENDTSFLARTYRTPNFEVPWHQHTECELILFTEGSGLSFVGNYVDEFKIGDIFFIGANVPHTFQKRDNDLIASAVVVQFRKDFLGREFMTLPESQPLQKLFDFSVQGMKIKGQPKIKLKVLIKELEYLKGLPRIIHLCNCLQILLHCEYITLSTPEIKLLDCHNKERIETIFRYTTDSFQKKISLSHIAQIADLSVPAFCTYFKKCTKKTYIDFLNEIRIGFACKLLLGTNRTVLDICYESGYNTLANFNKQFLKIKGITPSKYRNISRI